MAAEKEQGVWNKEIHLVFLFDDGGEGINAVSHVGVTTDYVDAGKSTGIIRSLATAPKISSVPC